MKFKNDFITTQNTVQKAMKTKSYLKNKTKNCFHVLLDTI